MTSERDELVARLNHGWEICERETDQARRDRLELHWITVLRSYERVCDVERQAMEVKAA